MNFVTEDLRTAVTEAEEFEKNSKYKDLICGKYMKGNGVTATNFNKKLEKLKPYLSEEDIVYYRNFYDKHSKGVCCLPKGHSGSCKHKLCDSFSVNWRWVKGHSGDKNNDAVDEMARGEAIKLN